MSLVEMLPCLRCGEWAVPVSLVFGVPRRETNTCLRCDCEHFLEIKPRSNGYDICYQRYTLRYPLELYDEGVAMPFVQIFAREAARKETDYEIFSGPVIIYPRRRRFSTKEIRHIWSATAGSCHLCCHRWKLDQRGRFGWHIDHIIPHIGGGLVTETIANLRVACWKCNLKKGRGYTAKQVRFSLQRLVTRLHEGRQRILTRKRLARD